MLTNIVQLVGNKHILKHMFIARHMYIKLAQTFHQNGTNNPSFRVRGGHTSYCWVLTITHNKNVTVRHNEISHS